MTALLVVTRSRETARGQTTLLPCREQGQDTEIAVLCKLASVGLAVILPLDFKGMEAQFFADTGTVLQSCLIIFLKQYLS